MVDNTVINDPNTKVLAGRPRVPLLTGQQHYIERAYYHLGMSQAKIARNVGVAIPRIRRYLIERGLYAPRSATRSELREQVLDDAVQAYIDGEKVVEICNGYDVNPAELYRRLRQLEVPFRTKDYNQRTRTGRVKWLTNH